MSHFHDDAHVDNYLKTGRFPKIHDAIFGVIREYAPFHKTAVDLGACYGLISNRLIQEIKVDQVIAVEGNKTYLNKFVSNNRIKVVQDYISGDTAGAIGETIKEAGATLLVARRVFPEIGPEWAALAREAFYSAGIETIVLEGRKPTSKATNPLHNADKECGVLAPRFRVIAARGDVRVLERR